MKLLRIVFLIISLTFVSNVFAQSVYITKTGEKYHTNVCHYLKYSKKEIKLELVISIGYEACSVCKPLKRLQKLRTSASLTTQFTDSIKKTIAAQCIGKTKSGRRCKRKTKNANGRCYQH